MFLAPDIGAFIVTGTVTTRCPLTFRAEVPPEMRRYNRISSLDEQPTPPLNSEAIDVRTASE